MGARAFLGSRLMRIVRNTLGVILIAIYPRVVQDAVNDTFGRKGEVGRNARVNFIQPERSRVTSARRLSFSRLSRVQHVLLSRLSTFHRSSR